METLSHSLNSSHQINGIDEDEAALYDRQIRLWGLEAQNRMRQSSVLIINLTGIASEVCKNIVLAGIGSITISDQDLVKPEDLGAGFFFRQEDIGQERVHAGRDRINALNPRVKVNGLTQDLGSKLKDLQFLKTFDIICLNDSDSITISELNLASRKAGVPLFVSGSLGMDGYVFADLINHSYLMDKVGVSPSEEIEKVPVKHSQSFIPFQEMIKGTLHHVLPRRIKKISAMLLACLTIFEFQSTHEGQLPRGPNDLPKLIEISEKLKNDRKMTEAPNPNHILERLSRSSRSEFVPTCAIVGSVLSQEVLNALGGKQPPIVNLFVFDGQRCSGDIYALGVTRNR